MTIYQCDCCKEEFGDYSSLVSVHVQMSRFGSLVDPWELKIPKIKEELCKDCTKSLFNTISISFNSRKMDFKNKKGGKE